jgi:phosphoserine phosphatase
MTTHVATLVTGSETRMLNNALVERARAALPQAGVPTWLEPDVAADIAFNPASGSDTRHLGAKVAATLGDIPVDVVVQPLAHRRKRLFLADMDSTMIRQECIDELADHAGLKTHVAAITERAMRGEIEFEPALRERVALLRGLGASVVDDVIASRITLTPGGRTLVATMRANGAHTCLVSGGFTLFTGPIAAMIGFDENRANSLVVADGRFAGTVAEPILGKNAKLATLQELQGRLGLKREDTMAIGDGANDIPMIEAAGLGVAFHGKPVVAQAARAQINHGDLTALLYIQGYRRDEFIEPK